MQNNHGKGKMRMNANIWIRKASEVNKKQKRALQVSPTLEGHPATSTSIHSF